MNGANEGYEVSRTKSIRKKRVAESMKNEDEKYVTRRKGNMRSEGGWEYKQ